MYMIIAPIATDLAKIIQHYRKKYDPLAEVIPPHITVIKPFRYSNRLSDLYIALGEAGEIFAPIKASIAGWDVHNWDVEGQTNYQLRLPIMSGRQELTALRNTLLEDSLDYLPGRDEKYWPHVVFGRFSKDSDAEKAKKEMETFESQFVFRVTHLELMYRDNPIHPWQSQKSFNLKATVAGARRKKRITVEES